MVGIVSYGIHLPFYRLDRKALGNGLTGEKAFSSFDEDSVTMAVSAVIDCLYGLDRNEIDGIFFASTTFPYSEKQSASTIASAADLRHDILSADYANSIKASTTAMRSAVDAVKAGSAKCILVASGDTRVGIPGSSIESLGGDGAAAILIGKENVILSLEESHSICSEIIDVWRSEGSKYVRAWEPRFSNIEGYQKSISQAIMGLLKKTGQQPSDFSKVVLFSPDQKIAALTIGALGFNPKVQLQDGLFNSVGSTGTSHVLMSLIGALEDAKPGDNILMANYGNGADAFYLRVTEDLTKYHPHKSLKTLLSNKKVVQDYRVYLYNRNLLPEIGPIYPVPFGSISPPAMFRETSKNIRLHGSKCTNCGVVQYPQQRVCFNCNKKDLFQTIRLSDKVGKIFTFSVDHFSSTIDQPSVIAVVDFVGGGRMECFLTDRVVENVCIGMEVEMTFRRLFFREDVANYFWKARPRIVG